MPQSATAQPRHGQPTSARDGLQTPLRPRDETFGFSGIEQHHGTAHAYAEDLTVHEHEDFEMDIERHELKNGIQVRKDVTVQ